MKLVIGQVKMLVTSANYERLFTSRVEKPKGKRPFGRPTNIWEDNIKMDLGETEREVVEWVHLVHNRDQ
jgi:hypothetical protein